MEVDGQWTSKIIKIASQGNDIIEVVEESINQNYQNKPMYIENEAEQDISTSEHTISQTIHETQQSHTTFKIK